jgi:hypothetical protein
MLKHLLYSQDNIKMTFCLVFIIWFIILLIVRKKVGNNPAKAKAWKCLCLVPLAAAIICKSQDKNVVFLLNKNV